MILKSKPYKVLIVDDHSVVRHGLRNLLEGEDGIDVCCEASNGREALAQVIKMSPDMAILDLTMPEMNGLDAARAIREASPQTQILVLSMHFSEEIAREVLRCGARGYILKSDANTELLTALHRVRSGEVYFTSQLATTIAQTFARVEDEDVDDSPLPGTPLTAREVEIVELLAQGKTNKEVASALGVSTRTVESHREHIMHKMNFQSLAELVRFAIRRNLVES